MRSERATGSDNDRDTFTLVFVAVDYSEIHTKEAFQDRPHRLQPLSSISVDLSAEMTVVSDDQPKVRGDWITSSNTSKARGASLRKTKWSGIGPYTGIQYLKPWQCLFRVCILFQGVRVRTISILHQPD